MRIVLKLIFPFFLVLLAYGIYSWLAGKKKAPGKYERPASVKPVSSGIVEFRDYQPTITAHGRIRSEHPVNLTAEVSGTVQPGDFKFKEGSRFLKNQVLLKLDDRSARLNLKSSISDLLNATAAVLPEIKSELPNSYSKWKTFFETLSFKQLPPLPRADDQKEKLYLSRFNFYKLYFAAENNKILLEKHSLVAPFSGTIVQSYVRSGAAVSKGMLLGTLVGTDKLEIEVPLSSTEAGWLNKQVPAEIIISETGEKVYGTVDRISESITDKNQSVSAYIRLKGGRSKNILDGMFAQVNLKARNIPNTYSFSKKYLLAGDYIYLVKNSRLKKTKVENIKIGEGTSFITSGISAGDTIVTESIQDAIDDMQVNAVINGVPSIKAADPKKESGKHRPSHH